MAFVSWVNPGIGFIGSVINYITSENNSAEKLFVIDIVSKIIPGGLIKDLIFGVTADILEASEMSSAVNKITPYNDIVLSCHTCHKYTHYYVHRDNKILCSDCLKDEINRKTVFNDRIYVLNQSIYNIHRELFRANKVIGETHSGKVLIGRTLISRQLISKELISRNLRGNKVGRTCLL